MEMSLKFGCLPYTVGKQPSIPMINLEVNGRYDEDDESWKLEHMYRQQLAALV